MPLEQIKNTPVVCVCVCLELKMAVVKEGGSNDERPTSAKTSKTNKTNKTNKSKDQSKEQIQDTAIPKVIVNPKTPRSNHDGKLLPPTTPGRAQIPRIPSPTSDTRMVSEKIALQREATRLKNPHNAVRMTTVTMSAR